MIKSDRICWTGYEKTLKHQSELHRWSTCGLLCNIVLKVELLPALQKPSSAKEMLIQDVKPEWGTDIKPNSCEPGAEDTTGQLAHGPRLPLRWTSAGRAEGKLK